MATLGATSLTGCNSIPGFIAAGSKMTFEMATAPINWTKDTSKNQSTLRIVSGSLSPGGNSPFSTVFTPAFPVSTTSPSASSPTSTPSTSSSLSYNPASAGPLSISPATISNPQMTAHSHPYSGWSGLTHQIASGSTRHASPAVGDATGTTGSGGSHTHTGSTDHGHFTGSGPHSHPLTPVQHSHTFSASLDFGIQYIDVIIASKD